MSTESVLSSIGVTFQQARDFIYSHTEQPLVIFEAALINGVTTSMLSDITGVSSDVISEYFASFGLNTDLLDDVSILVNSDLGSLAHLVEFNNHNGVLSTSSLREEVKSLFEDDPSSYDGFFGPVFDYQQKADGIYTPDELGVTHLGNIPASDENIESLFFGTLVNSYMALDETELQQLTEFPVNESNLDVYQALLFDALSDTPAVPIWPNDILAEQVVSYAANLIDDFWNDVTVFGILDHSFPGLAMAEL